MSVDPVSGNATSLNMHKLTPAVDNTAKGVTASNKLPVNSTVNSSRNNEKPASKSAAVNQENPNSIIEGKDKPVRAISAVLIEYTQQGELLTKFMDSKNNVLYQVPSEMELKMEELMKESDKTADLKG